MLRVLGNDIVDLSCALALDKASDPRYLQKICLPSEWRQIHASSSPNLTLWRIWTIKEAVYKAITQVQHFRAFIPKKIEVTLLDELWAESQTNWGNYIAQTSSTKDYLHSLAATQKATLLEATTRVVDQLNPAQAGELLRQRLLEDYATQQQLDVLHLKVQKLLELPWIYQNEQRLPCRLSLSHHGTFGAYAILPIA